MRYFSSVDASLKSDDDAVTACRSRPKMAKTRFRVSKQKEGSTAYGQFKMTRHALFESFYAPYHGDAPNFKVFTANPSSLFELGDATI